MRRQQKRSHDVRSFCFCRHLCTVLSPATSHRSNVTRLLTGSPSPAAGGRKRGAVSRKKYRVQRPLQGQLHDNISDRSQVRAARTSQSPFCHSVTFPLPGESLFEAPTKKIARCAVFLFLSAPLHSSLTCDTALQ